MKKIINNKIILGIVILLAVFLRFYQLGANPPSLTWDEAAWGYNAYSLGIDGRDEFGKFLPIQYLESFGDFKPPVYAYLDILPVKILGLNEFAVRFPSAFFGVLTVLVTYFLVRRLFRVEALALMSGFFLAISPWHINLSRAAFEANIATFFIISGVWLFLAAVQDKKWYLLLSAGSFILSMYAFNTARIVAPLLLILLGVGFREQLLKIRTHVLIAIIIGVILITPLAQFLTSPQAKLRFQEVNIFSDVGVIERTNQLIANDSNAWWSKIVHNRRLAYGVEYLKHYFDNLNPNFLFIKGDGNPKFSTQDVGQLYLWDLPFLVFGIFLLLRRREGNWWIVPLWLLVGIIPAGTARETPHALRIETTLPTFQILIAYGFYQFISGIRNYESGIRKLFLIASCLLLAANFLYYYHGYYTHYPREFSGEWQYGYSEIISYTQRVESQYDKIVATESLGRPYIYVLFYKKEDPKVFRETAKIYREAYGFVHVEGYKKYLFTKNPKEHLNSKKTLFIDTPENVPGGATVLKTFYLLNGEPVLSAYSI